MWRWRDARELRARARKEGKVEERRERRSNLMEDMVDVLWKLDVKELLVEMMIFLLKKGGEKW